MISRKLLNSRFGMYWLQQKHIQISWTKTSELKNSKYVGAGNIEPCSVEDSHLFFIILNQESWILFQKWLQTYGVQVTLLQGLPLFPLDLWQCVESVLMCLLHILKVRSQQLWNTEPALTHVESQGQKTFTLLLNKRWRFKNNLQFSPLTQIQRDY